MWEMLKFSPVRLRGNPCLPEALAWTDKPSKARADGEFIYARHVDGL